MRSIRARLTLSLWLGPGLILLVAGFGLDLAIERKLASWYDLVLMERAQTLITLTKRSETGLVLDFADEFIPDFANPKGPDFFELWRSDGTLIERSNSLKGQPMVRDWVPTPMPLFKNQNIQGMNCRLLVLSFVPQDETRNTLGVSGPHPLTPDDLTLLIARDRTPFDQMLLTIRAIVALTFLSLVAVLVWLVQRTVASSLAPLEDIAAQVKRLDLNQAGTSIHLAESPGELTPIIAQLNHLLRQLDGALARERQFTSDIAHELRTPIAELRALSEVVLTYKGDNTEQPFFQDVFDTALEMEKMVSNLLSLTRLDDGTQVVWLEPVVLSDLVEHVWTRSARVAQARGVSLERQIPEHTVIFSDALMLEQIIQNTINNAVSYAPTHACVQVVFSEGDQVLCLRNPAPDLDTADLVPMFDRFWRKDKARTGGNNSGLGLALVKSFCDLLNLQVRAELDQGILVITLSGFVIRDR